MITTIEYDGRIRFAGKIDDEVQDALIALFDGTGELIAHDGYLFWIWGRGHHIEWQRRANMLYELLVSEGYEVSRVRGW